MFEIGSLLDDRYKIVAEINNGAMGTVYKAVDLLFGEVGEPFYVAIKLDNVQDDKEISAKTKKEAQDAFLREAEVLRKLRHPNLPVVTDRGVTGEWFVMDFIRGQNLAAILETNKRANKKFETNRVLNWAEQILDALTYLHGNNHLHKQYIHRDIKPANIILSENDKIILVDFGLVTKTGSVLKYSGTRRYNAPEQLPGARSQVGAPTDLYALSATIYDLVGFELIPAERRQQRQPDPLRPIPEPLMSEAVSAVFFKALHLNMEDRWKTATEMLEALREAQRPEPTFVVSPSQEDPTLVSNRPDNTSSEAITRGPLDALRWRIWVWGSAAGALFLAVSVILEILNSTRLAILAVSAVGLILGFNSFKIARWQEPQFWVRIRYALGGTQACAGVFATAWMALMVDSAVSGYWPAIVGHMILAGAGLYCISGGWRHIE